MRIIRNSIIPFGKGMLAINLFGVLFTKGPLSVIDLNHERIHTRQMRELAYIFFYIFYVTEWFLRLFQYGFSKKAYFNISFEREAYARQNDLKYLQTRPHFASFHYLRKKSSSV